MPGRKTLAGEPKNPEPTDMSTSANPVATNGTAARQSSTTTKGEASVDRRRLLGLLLSTAACLLADSAEARSFGSAAAAALRRRALARQAPKQPATKQPPDKPRDVVIQRSKHPEAAAHIDHAQRQGQPSVLHIDRGGAEGRRRASTGSVHRHTSPGPKFDRDEYPPAFTREGGPNANVRFIPRQDNRGAGSSMSHQTRDLKDGDKIRVIVAD